MRYVLLDLLLALLALVVLVLLALGVWRRVKALAGELARAGESVGAVTEELARAQASGPLGAGGLGAGGLGAGPTGASRSASRPVRRTLSTAAPRRARPEEEQQ